MNQESAAEPSSDPHIDTGDGLLRVLRCRGCGDVIGVYEPLVVCDNSHSRTTSRAAEPALDVGGVYYHRLCFAGLPGPQ